MDRAEAPGFLTHAVLMLKNSAHKIVEDWDNPDVQLSITQTEDMRRNMRDAMRLLKEIEPYVREFEKVSAARKATFVAV